MDGPAVIWITHPSFRVLSVDHYTEIVKYFESTLKSGGGEVVDHHKVVGGNGEPSAFLIKFSDEKFECQFKNCGSLFIG